MNSTASAAHVGEVSGGFALLKEALRGKARHVSPFFVLGDPTPSLSLELAVTAVRAGASMLELGLAYSDPSADGPAIQEADGRALAAGMTTQRSFALAAQIRKACPSTPMNLLVYGNLVHAQGLDSFCHQAQAAGVSSLLVPDVPLEEARPLSEACRRAGLGHCSLVGPMTAPERLEQIEKQTDAFLYLVARQAVTGVTTGGMEATEALVQRMVKSAKMPLCVGFGLSHPSHVKGVLDAGARIAVVGSLFAAAIGRTWDAQRAQDSGAEVVRTFLQTWQPFAQLAG